MLRYFSQTDEIQIAWLDFTYKKDLTQDISLLYHYDLSENGICGIILRNASVAVKDSKGRIRTAKRIRKYKKNIQLILQQYKQYANLSDNWCVFLIALLPVFFGLGAIVGRFALVR